MKLAWASVVAPGIKELAATPDYQRSIPGAHGGKRISSHKLPSGLHM